MTVRALASGDEVTVEEGCRLFGHVGALDATVFLARPEALLLEAEDDGSVVGWVYGHELIRPDGERTMLLYALDVAEHARKQGHGSALVRSFVDRARERGCTEVWVLTDDVNLGGLATYSSTGGRRDPVPQVMFSWRLTGFTHDLTPLSHGRSSCGSDGRKSVARERRAAPSMWSLGTSVL